MLQEVPIEIKWYLALEAKPIKILDWGENVLRNKRVPLVRALWRNSQIKEEIWEREYEIKEKYPHLFSKIGMRFKF